jgi:cyclase
VVLSIDAKRRPEGGWGVFVAGGRRDTGLDLLEWAVRGAQLGAGEIVFNSIDRDGMKSGFDLEGTRALARAVEVPVVASGGAGSAADMVAVLEAGEADAALAAGIFHRREVAIAEVKAAMAAAGVPVRFT